MMCILFMFFLGAIQLVVQFLVQLDSSIFSSRLANEAIQLGLVFVKHGFRLSGMDTISG